MHIHSQRILSIFDVILNTNLCSNLSRECNFIQRTSSKLQGHEFIKIMIIPSDGVSEDSLNGLCKRMKDYNPDVDITAQALCERINNPTAPLLIKNIFYRLLYHTRKLMTAQSPSLLKALGRFRSVKVEDSTVIELNQKISKYEGTKRSDNQKAQIKIDLIHDLVSNQIIDIQLESGRVPDQALSYRILKFIEEGDLIIRDLGYFVLPVLKAIAISGAYFLSRLLPNIKIYLNRDDREAVCLSAYVSHKYKKKKVIELHVFLGELKVPARLVLYKAPQKVVRVRLTNAKKRIKDTGRDMSNGKKFTIEYSAFVTNVPIEMLSTAMIGTVYQLRWEIELIFKQWKSLLKMDVLKGVNENRIECLIWGRLCMVLLLALISQEFGRVAEEKGKELSITKVIKYVMRGDKFGLAIRNHALEKFMEEMAEDVSRRLCMDKRSRKSMRERLILEEGYCGTQHVDLKYVA